MKSRSSVAVNTRKAREYDAQKFRNEANSRASAPHKDWRPLTHQQEKSAAERVKLDTIARILGGHGICASWQ